jgi:hypothetical protein
MPQNKITLDNPLVGLQIKLLIANRKWDRRKNVTRRHYSHGAASPHSAADVDSGCRHRYAGRSFNSPRGTAKLGFLATRQKILNWIVNFCSHLKNIL